MSPHPEKRDGGRDDRPVDVWADINHLPWPSFCRCKHEKSMGGRWTWERGDAVWMDAEQRGGRKMEERQQSRGRRRSIIRNLTLTNIHSVGVQKTKL